MYRYILNGKMSSKMLNLNDVTKQQLIRLTIKKFIEKQLCLESSDCYFIIISIYAITIRRGS